MRLVDKEKVKVLKNNQVPNLWENSFNDVKKYLRNLNHDNIEAWPQVEVVLGKPRFQIARMADQDCEHPHILASKNSYLQLLEEET